MITYQVESFTQNIETLQSLLIEHWQELALNKDKVPLDPQYEIYTAKEKLGELMFTTAREDGELIGYFIGFVGAGLHYKTCMTCTMDIFYIKKEKRNGSTGRKLFRFTEKQLKNLGVQRWVVGSKVHAPADKFFEFLGFNPIERFYSKWIGE